MVVTRGVAEREMGRYWSMGIKFWLCRMNNSGGLTSSMVTMDSSSVPCT